MIRPKLIQESMERIQTVGDLSQLFLSLASLQIGRIKQQTQASQRFFDELWQIYTALRTRQGHRPRREATIDKHLFIVITAEGGFSGDIDEKLIEWMLGQYDRANTDIVCIGHHGAIKLAQAKVPIVKYFKLPADNDQIELNAIIDLVEDYVSATVFYQNYVSLAIQDVKRIDLQKVVKQLEPTKEQNKELISEGAYIFEPSVEAVVSYMESTMLSIALAQLILESKLAQYASRFRAMSSSKERAQDLYRTLRLDYFAANRAQADQRMNEILAGLRHVRKEQEVVL